MNLCGRLLDTAEHERLALGCAIDANRKVQLVFAGVVQEGIAHGEDRVRIGSGWRERR